VNATLQTIIREVNVDIDGRRVHILHGRDTGKTGTLLYYHNGGNQFNRWVARVLLDDGSTDCTDGLNYDPFAIGLVAE
jgi:hypothetical protein